jgi:hypothetical protein
MTYEEELEKRVEELQAQVASLQMWVPSWRRLDENKWEYHRGPIVYGHVYFRNGELLASGVNRQNPGVYKHIDDAQAHVELWVENEVRKEQPTQ